MGTGIRKDPGGLDDGYIKVKLSLALQVLADLKTVFKEDAGLELNVAKTAILRLRVVRSRLRSMLHTASLLPAPH